MLFGSEENKSGLIPEFSEGDFESWNWRVPKDLMGKVVSLEELTSLFPEIKILEENEFGVVYGISYTNDSPLKLAYQCKRGNHFVMGPPKIQDENSIDAMHPLCGREGFDAYCTQCGFPLYEKTTRIS